MKSPLKLFVQLGISLLFLGCQGVGQEKGLIESRGGYVNFNLDESPVSNPKRQEVSLYGCDTIVTTRYTRWNGEENLEWNVKNQVLTGIPYGEQEKDGRSYYISKYYMASPPVMEPLEGSGNSEQKAIIGLVIPDQFTFFGEKPVQIVNLNYNILEPVYLNYVDVDYEYVDRAKNPTCGDLGVDLIPLNIQCKDFRWLNQVSTNSIQDAQGASGIARLYNKKGQRQVFLPSYEPGEECLDCEITILDDILIDHEVFFVDGERLVKSISLTDFYENYGNKRSIGLSCRLREELPAGCKKED